MAVIAGARSHDVRLRLSAACVLKLSGALSFRPIVFDQSLKCIVVTLTL